MPVESAGGAAVSARGWGWRHAGRKAWATRDLDFEIQPGERVLLLGASGAGKSTLLHGLAALLGTDDEGEQQGELLVDGARPADARGRVGMLLQDPDSQVILARIGDDVAFGCENLGLDREEIWRRVGASLVAVGLELPLDHSTSRLSGGQKQRLALAGVLAMRPRLLLLDEPTANLDPEGVLEVRDAVGSILERTDATFVVVEHRVGVWREHVNRVIVLDPRGGVLADGHPDEVLSEQGERLAVAGVWVPGHPPAWPTRHRRVDNVENGQAHALLQAKDLAVQRIPGVLLGTGINLAVTAGEATAISGPNGAGKSTLALTMAGLLAPAAGSVVASSALAGETGSEPIKWRSRELLTRIGTVFQDPEHQFITSSVRRELEVGPRALDLPENVVAARVDELLQRLRLDHLAAANPFTLSGGEKRRLSVATVLATQPRILVLDEPTFGQDARTWQELVALLAELLDSGSAVLAVTHDSMFIDALADVRFRMDSNTVGAIS